MNSKDDRIAARLAEIRAQQEQLGHESDERQARAPGPADVQPRSSAARSALFLVAVILIAVALLGTAVTLNRLAGKKFDAAQTRGQATVTACQKHGPITAQGFGYWYRCTATIAWDDGRASRTAIDAVFTPSDLGHTVQVGDRGKYHTRPQLARADEHARPWLAWIGYAAGFLALLPTFVAVLFLRELLRPRKR